LQGFEPYIFDVLETISFSKKKIEIWKHGQLFGMQKNGQATNIQNK
jgi:hypothetical protein